MTSICWFRRDLRLSDNPAWAAATAADRVVPVFVVDDDAMDKAGPHRRRALVDAVRSLRDDLEHAGHALVIAGGPAPGALSDLVEHVAATEVHLNAEISPWGRRRDEAVAAALPPDVQIRSHWGTVVHEPGTVLTARGTLSRVFTPFWKRWAQTPVPVEPEPGAAAGLPVASTADLPDLDPLDRRYGADAAHERLARFLDVIERYPTDRDFPALAGTSELSADLHFGTIGPREVLAIVGEDRPGADAFARQLAWRDWYAHLLAETPTLPTRAMRPEYDAIAWRRDPDGLEAWRQGRTGYPIVDAGMRELATTGRMHNRVRMVAASFLVKHLLVDWREGERWFRRMLIDGDVAQNAGNWQWVAGTGPDAAPYFRIFNPTAQSQKFDRSGAYLRAHLPELAALDAKTIHEPATAAPLDLAAAGVILGDTYPAPIVDHRAARERCLAAYKGALAQAS